MAETISPQLSPEDIERFGQDPLETFRSSLLRLEERIVLACKRSGRRRDTVRLLPITKTVPAHILRFAFEAGLRSFGENKVQEAQAKQVELTALPIDWSIVGHLQTNKAKHLTRFAREFHALDSLRVAEALNDSTAGDGLDVYVQVNTSGEDTKYGLAPSDLPAFVEALERFPNLKPRGLMTLAFLSADHGRVRSCFRLLRALRDDAVKRNATLTELSMGMTGDFELAIEEGADVVRVGQAIFGKRPTPPGHFWPGLLMPV